MRDADRRASAHANADANADHLADASRADVHSHTDAPIPTTDGASGHSSADAKRAACRHEPTGPRLRPG
ncbi:MAG TPA: hypothetical protein VHJ82_07630 [Actinomycetota bacterium]|nr:hypothetical protein [Actinomycetota bacterium]